MGSFSTKMHKYAEKSILKSFGLTPETHFAIPAGSGSTGAVERLHKILRINEIVLKEKERA